MVTEITCVSITAADKQFCKSKGIVVSKLLAQTIDAVKTGKFSYNYMKD